MAIRIGKKGKSPAGAIMAILGGGAVAAGVMLTPMGLVEMAATSSGLSALLPAAAPPLGETARLILAFAAGVSGMAMVAGLRAIGARLIGGGPSVIRIGYEIGYDDEAVFDFAAAAPADGPRRPLFASSDLEGLAPLADKPVQPGEGLRLPIAPAPLDDSELELVATMQAPARTIAPVIEAPASPEPANVIEDPSGVLAAARVQPSDYSALSITELVERFERGLTHRRDLIAKAVAAKRASEAEAQARAAWLEPARIAPQAQTEPGRKSIDAEVDEALRAALGTLQRMTARAA